jgi:hypothetical protein
MTLFSLSLTGHWMLDRLTNRALQFSLGLVEAMEPFITPPLEPMLEMIELSLPLLFMDSVGLSFKNYTPVYWQGLEEHFPFHFASLSHQRRRLYQKQKVLNLFRMILT